MNLKKNEIEIIKLLIASTNYISSYDIATATGINRRLVRDEMLNVKIILKSLGYELVSKTSKGYIIEGKSSHSLQGLFHIIEDAERQREYVFPTLPQERQSYILKRLVENNTYMKIDDLADELLISRSTISSDLKKARQDIKKYGLIMKQKPNYGICIVGDEVNKRKPLCDSLFTNLRQSEMFYDYLNSYITNPDSLENGIIKIIKHHHVEMSDIALCDFLLSLSVSITRILAGHTIAKSPDLKPILGRNEFECAKDIAHFIEDRNECQMNEHEINQIAIELICKRSSKGVTPQNSPEIHHLVNEILSEIYQQTLLQFNDSHFYKTFTLYVEAAIIRLTYKEKIRNPLFDELKTTYPLAYELAEITSSIIKKYTHQALSMSELAFFAIIFNTVIHNHKTNKKRVLLLCGLGGGAEQLNAKQIIERFENEIDIVKTSQYYKLPDEDLNQYDFIISTVPIHKDLLIPHINISQIINQDDLNKIDNYLSYLFNKNRIETLFHPKLYKTNIKARNKTDVVNEFFKMLKAQYPHIKESFKNNLMIKDQNTFIPYKNKIAIIRLNKPLNQNNILAVLILQKPIIWHKKEVQMIILFSFSDSNNYIYNTLTNILTNLSIKEKGNWNLIEDTSYPMFLKMMIRNQF